MDNGARVVEPSFIIPVHQFVKVVRAGWVDEQESFVFLSDKDEQDHYQAVLQYNDVTRPAKPLGRMVQVDKETALASPAYTAYRQNDTMKYWATKKEDN